MTIVINEIYSNSGKYHNTVIFNTIENAANIPLASFKKTIKSYFLGEYSFFCNLFTVASHKNNINKIINVTLFNL